MGELEGVEYLIVWYSVSSLRVSVDVPGEDRRGHCDRELIGNF